MTITAVFVVSLDGKITHGSDPHPSHWASSEDQAWFSSLIKRAKVIIMGRATWEASQKNTKLSHDKLRIVVTHSPDDYEAHRVPGQLEFTSENPTLLVDRLKKEGHKEILMVGGAKLFTQFLKNKLIDALYLTLEPKLLGNGRSLVAEEDIDISLELVDQKKLNPQGALLLSYRVRKDQK